jgi:putative RecB family exonuclease
MGEVKWIAETGHRSVSQLGTMAGCGYAYYLDKVLRVPRRNATWFVQGSAVHVAVEAYELSLRSMSVEDALQAFEDAWGAEMAKERQRQPDPKMWMVGGKKTVQTDEEERRAKGRQQTADYITHNGPDHEWQPVEVLPGLPAVELGFELDFDGIKVVGYIDQVRQSRKTGKVRVVDVKTGTKMPESPYQFGTYAVAVAETLGFEVEDGTYWMCKDNKESKPKPLRMYTRDIVADWYRTMDKMIKDGNFLATPGGGCFTCTVRPYCKHEAANPIPWPPETPAGMDFS